MSKSVNGSCRVNKNTTGSGVLRYALHLRFLCPFPKRCSRSIHRCKSNPLCAPTVNKDIGGERRFYLYSDMRVVFPQRHSDADEGKVSCLCVFNWFFRIFLSRSMCSICLLFSCTMLSVGWAFVVVIFTDCLLAFTGHADISFTNAKIWRFLRGCWYFQMHNS